jgi:hypothetical protein
MEFDGTVVTVSPHAAQRFQQRGGARATTQRAMHTIATSVIDAVHRGSLIAVDRRTHLAIVGSRGARPMYAVLGVTGLVERPVAIVVKTILSGEMAVHTFGHMIGVVSELAAA